MSQHPEYKKGYTAGYATGRNKSNKEDLPLLDELTKRYNESINQRLILWRCLELLLEHSSGDFLQNQSEKTTRHGKRNLKEIDIVQLKKKLQ